MSIHRDDSSEKYSGFNETDGATEDFLKSSQFHEAVRKTSSKQFRIPTPTVTSSPLTRRPSQAGCLPPHEEISDEPVTTAGGTSTGSTRSIGGSSSSRRTVKPPSLPEALVQRVPILPTRAAGFSAGGGRGWESGGDKGSDEWKSLCEGSLGTAMEGARARAAQALVDPPVKSKEKDLKEKMGQIEELMEESVKCNSEGSMSGALEKAEESVRLYVRQFSEGPDDAGSNEERQLAYLYYSLNLNLAAQFTAAGFYSNALQIYGTLLKHPCNKQPAVLRVMMGNVYFLMGSYRTAIKNYSMGSDQVHGHEFERMRRRIKMNSAVAHFRLRKFEDAAVTFTLVAEEEPTVKAWFGVITCHYALKQVEEMKQSFRLMLEGRKEIAWFEQHYSFHHQLLATASDQQDEEAWLTSVGSDDLKVWMTRRHEEDDEMICRAAKMIAESMEGDFSAGYDWCLSHVSKSKYARLVVNLEIDKTIGFIRRKEYKRAVETLAQFDRNYALVSGTAATNLAFLQYLVGSEGGVLAEIFVEMALHVDRYNSSAYVNKGNIYLRRGEYLMADACYKEAWACDSSCMESLYNQGLTAKTLGRTAEAISYFTKLQDTLGQTPQVLYQLADLNGLLGEKEKSRDYFVRLLSLVPTDSGVLSRLAELYLDTGDISQAFLYYSDAYRYDPSNTRAMRWLGEYYIRSEYVEKALEFFDKGALAQPNNLHWKMMGAYCHKRAGNVQKALDAYRDIHQRFPDNRDCLKALIRLCKDLNLQKDLDAYERRLKAAERLEMKKVVKKSRRRGRITAESGDQYGLNCVEMMAACGHCCEAEDLGSDDVERWTGQCCPGLGDAPCDRAGDNCETVSYEDPLRFEISGKRPTTSCRGRTIDLREAGFDCEEVLGADLLPD